MSLVVVATVRPIRTRRDQVRDVLSAASRLIHDEPGCELYALHEGDDSFIFVEQWRDEASLDAHNEGAALAQVAKELEGMLAEPPTVIRCVPLPIGDAPQGRLR